MVTSGCSRAFLNSAFRRSTTGRGVAEGTKDPIQAVSSYPATASATVGISGKAFSRALEATANRLPEFQREVQALEARLETLKRILPPEKEMPDLMRRIQYLAAQSSLSIRKFNPTAVVQRDFYQEVPVSIDVDGTYHNMGAFLDRVSRMSRLVNMGDIKIKSQTNQTLSRTVGISATATTYVYVDAPPPPPAATKGGARPRPGGVGPPDQQPDELKRVRAARRLGGGRRLLHP